MDNNILRLYITVNNPQGVYLVDCIADLLHNRS